MVKKMSAKDQKAFKAEVEASLSSVEDLGKGLQDSAKDILGATSAAKQYASELDSIRKLQYQAQKAGQQALSDELAGQTAIIKTLQQKDKKMQAIKKAYQGVNDEADDLVKTVETFVKKLPGGDYIVKMFGIDKLGAKFKNVLNKQAKKLYESLEGTGKVMGGLGKLAKGFGGFLAAGIAASVVAFLAFEESVKKVAEDLGVSHTQAKLLTTQIKEAVNAEGMMLATTQDALDVVSVMANEFGTMAGISPQLAADVAEMGKAFGYSAKTAGQVQVAFESMGMESGMAVEMQRELAAEATKAGLNVGAVMDDIAQNSKKVAKFFGGNVKALKDAAIQAAKLGVNLDTMAGVADHLLDFEKSIAAQFELQALTGKNINLDLARQLALEGDIAGATKAVLSQVGDIHDFNNMDYLARKKLAEATGMSVEELQKSLTIQSKLGDLTEDQAAAMNNLGLSAAQIADMSDVELQNALAQQASADKMAKQVDKLKNVLMKALLPVANQLMFVFEALGPALSAAGTILGIAFKPIAAIAKTFGSIVEYISNSKTALFAVAGVMGAIIGYQTTSLAIEKGKAAVMLLQNTYMAAKAGLEAAAKMAAAGTLMTYIGQAAMTAFSSLSAIPFVGAALGAVAAAGAVALGMAYMNDGVIYGDDTVSKPRGGGKGGYGSRTLFGPEGAISFNNKDTIVAGTNLNYKMNDGVIAPQGALKVNDYASDMPDPPEARIVGIDGAPIVKLVAGFAAAINATAMIPKPVLLMNPFIATFETNPVMLMGSVLSGIFGGSSESDGGSDVGQITKKLDDVIFAIENMEINMDGQKVGGITRLIDSFRRR